MFGWKTYLSIEEQFLKANYYVAFDVENAHSNFLSQSIILLGAEIEHAFKVLCELIDVNAPRGDIGKYKEVILKNIPAIGKLRSALRENEEVQFFPFENWHNGKLTWWNIYTKIKHSTDDEKATMKVALTMLSAYQLLLILIEAYTPGEEERTAYTQLDMPRLLVPDLNVGIGQEDNLDEIFSWRFSTSELKEKVSTLT